MNFITKIGKYIFYLSLILNAILLMYLVGTLSFFLYISILFNIFLLWYMYQSLIENQSTEEDITLLFDSTEEFINHLENIHELEMYYGDQNLQALIDHSKSLINQYIDIQEKHYDVEVSFEEDEYDDDNNEVNFEEDEYDNDNEEEEEASSA